MKKYIIIGVLLCAVLIGGVIFLRHSSNPSPETASMATLPQSEEDILVPDPTYYLARIQPYLQDLREAINQKEYARASLANEEVNALLTKMYTVSVSMYAKEQVQYFLDASSKIAQGIRINDQAGLIAALEELDMLKSLYFQIRKSEL